MDAFLNRSVGYSSANRKFPNVRWRERAAVLKRADLNAKDLICDLQAASGYLTQGIEEVVGSSENIVCVEPSPSLARVLSPRYKTLVSSLDRIDVINEYFDKVLSLAGLHHAQSLSAVIQEACRVLKPSGTIVLSDVEVNSPQDRWLNDVVHNNTTTGHDGKFLNLGDLSRELKSSGIHVESEEKVSVPWEFTSVEQMVDFMKELFGLSSMTNGQVKNAIFDCFHVEESSEGVLLDWGLIYCKGRKNVI